MFQLSPQSATLDVMSGWFREARGRAEELESAGRGDEAAAAYASAAGLALQFAGRTENERERQWALEQHRALSSRAAGRREVPGSGPRPGAPRPLRRHRLTDLVGLEALHDDLAFHLWLLGTDPPPGLEDLPRPRNFLFQGPPGTGKTSTASAIAAELDYPLLYARHGDILDPYFGQTVRNLERWFQDAHRAALDAGRPAVLFIDEFEALCPATREPHETSERLKGALRYLLDGLDANEGPPVAFIGATNCPEALEPALRQRVDREFHFPLPSRALLQEMLRRKLLDRGHTLEPDLRLEELAERLEGRSGREVEKTARAMALHMLRRANPSYRRGGAPAAPRVLPLSRPDFEAALSGLERMSSGDPGWQTGRRLREIHPKPA